MDPGLPEFVGLQRYSGVNGILNRPARGTIPEGLSRSAWPEPGRALSCVAEAGQKRVRLIKQFERGAILPG